MSDPFVAEIRMFGFNFAPTGWAACDGQLLPISQNTALFSLLGTTYGGNGINNFALPDLRETFALGPGQGPGLSNRQLGERGGVASSTLTATAMPPHAHGLLATASATGNDPAGSTLATTATGASAYRLPGNTTSMAATSVATTGGGQAHENRQPALALMFCIALQGVYPPRT